MGVTRKMIGGCAAALIMGLVAVLPPDEIRTSQKAIEYLIDLEGCELKPYSCSAGVLTNGIGNTHGVTGEKITEQKAVSDLVANIQKKERRIASMLKTAVSDGTWDSLVLFGFNVGEGNLKHSTLLKKINAGERPENYCEEFRRWVFVNGKDCRKKSSHCAGIVKRREVERNFCLSGGDV